MFVEEYEAKQLIRAGGIPVPDGRIARSVAQAESAAAELAGSVMVKAQVPAGKRGKGGGIARCDTAEQAALTAEQMLGSTLGEHRIERVLVESCADIAAELYVAVTIDAGSASPMVMISGRGGVDIEEVHASDPDAVQMITVDIDGGLGAATAMDLAASAGLDPALQAELAGLLVTLYGLFRHHDAHLLEVNPLAITTAGELLALDCKLVVDDSARFRRPELGDDRPTGTELERRAREQGFLFVELDGDVGVLANGAGLTMATMDAVTTHGGSPANFLEVGGMAYTRATAALELVLANPNVTSLLVNLCGAYARTDVIAEGLIAGFGELRPSLGVSFCIHGTGEERARQLVRDELGIEAHDSMDDAVKEAVANARTAAAASAAPL